MKTIGGFTIATYEEAIEQGISCPALDNIENCEFCGKPLEYRGFVIDGKIEKLFKGKCKCDLAVKFAEEAEQAFIDTCVSEGLARAEQEKMNANDDGINKRYRGRTFDTYMVSNDTQESAKTMAITYANNFAKIKDREQNSMILYGGCGAGKTHLACAIANRLRKDNAKCIYTTFENLLLKIRETYDNQALSDNSIRNRYKNADLLIIDDLAKEKPTEFATSVLFDLINYRYENVLPMIITANHGREELIDRLTPQDGDRTKAEAIVSRIYEMCIAVPMSDIDDYRLGTQNRIYRSKDYVDHGDEIFEV